MDPDLEKDLHWTPNRVEWLANALIEIDKEIGALEDIKLKYQDEFMRLTATEDNPEPEK